MPNRNGTGPNGKGPMTGGGRGNCVSSNKNNYRVGASRGRRGGWRHRFFETGLFGWQRNKEDKQGE